MFQTVKHEYSSLLESGHIEKEIMLQLKDSVNVALDHINEPLSDWKELQETFKEPKLWVGLKLMPLPKPIRSVINQITTMRLQAANLQVQTVNIWTLGKHSEKPCGSVMVT